MLCIHLINLILYQLMILNLKSLLMFHCWSEHDLLEFSETLNRQHIAMQNINLNGSVILQDIPYRYLWHYRPKLGIYFDMNCEKSNKVIEQANNIGIFSEHFHWLIYDQHSNESRFNNIFKNISLSVNADIDYVIMKSDKPEVHNNHSSFLVSDVYNNGYLLGGKLNITSKYELECTHRSCGLVRHLSDLYERSLHGNRETLKDITMRVAVVVTGLDLNAPRDVINNFLMEEKNFHIDPLARLGFRIMQLVVESLNTNVTYEYYDCWSNSEYIGGIIGALVNQTADMASSPFVLTHGRLQFLTPLAATGDFHSVCMFRTPRNAGMQGQVFLEPFSKRVWIIFGVIIIKAALILWLAFSLEYYGQTVPSSGNYIPSLLTTCLISFGSACAQSSYLIPRSIGGRLVFMSLLIVSFIMYNYYTSVVVSSLLGSPLKSKINTLAELADSNLDVGLEPLPYTFTYLNFSSQPAVKRFVKNKISSKKNIQSVWYSAQDGILKMRNKPGFAFVFETSTGYQLIEKLYEPHEICDLNEILFRSDTLLFFQLHRNSSYKEIIKLKILRILETGIHSRHRQQWVRTHLNCLNNNLIINVGMEYAAPLLLMLVLSYAAVLVILLFELLWKRRQLMAEDCRNHK